MSERLRLGGFRGLATFPVRWAIDDGHFAAAGLDATFEPTTSSDAVMVALIDGGLDVAAAAPDNALAWATRTGAPLVVWYGGSSGPLSLVLAPGIDVADLRGASIAVDHPDTGWAPILLAILREHGIERDEISQVATGATARVFAALAEGRTPAAMLNEPWATRATTIGCRIAADHRTVAPGLLTSSGASLRGWLDADPDRAVAALRAIIAATGEILAAGPRDPAVAERLADHLGAPLAEAERILPRMHDPAIGWPATAAPDADGLRVALGLRGGIDAEASVPADIGAFLTTAIHERAVAPSSAAG
jgi:ABC-type nitrate/sulfonate/bicarbonate transport system substrate-binding protein